MANKKLADGLGINEHKNLDNFYNVYGGGTANPWSYTSTGDFTTSYNHPYDIFKNIRYFFSMEDVYSNGLGYTTPQLYTPPLDCNPAGPCLGAACSPSGWTNFDSAVIRYNEDYGQNGGACNKNYPKAELCTLAALARITDLTGFVRNFQYKHWDTDEWSSYTPAYPTVFSGNSLPCPTSNWPPAQVHLDEIQAHGAEMGIILNTAFPIFNQAHLNEFWHNCRDEEYHAFMIGFNSTFAGDSGATPTQDSDAAIGGDLYHNHTSFYNDCTRDDFIAIHPYSFGSGEQSGTLTEKPEFMHYNTDAPAGNHTEVKTMCDYATGCNKPLYITEIGWNSGQLPGGEAQQSAYSLRAYLLACACGIEKTFFYWGLDTPDGLFDTTGWFRTGWVPKQVYKDFEFLVSAHGEICFDSFVREDDNGKFALCFTGPNPDGSEDVIISWDCRSNVYPDKLAGNNTSNGMPCIDVRYKGLDLHTLLNGEDLGGSWHQGTCGAETTTPYTGLELGVTGVIKIDQCKAVAGTYDYYYEHTVANCATSCTNVQVVVTVGDKTAG